MSTTLKPFGVAAAALAVSALFAAPAVAGPSKTDRRADAVVTFDLGSDAAVRLAWRDGRGWHDDAYYRGRNDRRSDAAYYDERREREARRQALQQCRAAVNREAYYVGFRDVDFDGREIWRVGHDGYRVVLDAEFEGRKREFDSHVVCEVRRGRIVNLSGIPQPGRRGKGWQTHDRHDRYDPWAGHGGYGYVPRR